MASTRGAGRPQRREPQPQRCRQLHRLRGRRAGDHRRRRRDLHREDLQPAAVRDLDHAVGVSQPAHHRRRHAGRRPQFEARDVSCSLTAESAEFRLDLAAAYPPEAGLRSWNRAITLNRRAARVQVDDHYQLARPADRIDLSLMTPIRPVISGAISLGPTVLKFDSALKPLVDEIEVTDARLKPVWGDKLYRIRLVAQRPPLTAQWRLELT